MSKIFVIGTGPGSKAYIAPHALDALNQSDIIVGYKTYIDLIKDYTQGKELVSSGMMKEVERCKQVLELARTGKTVSLISSGDPGIYGMAGIMLEIVDEAQADIDIEIIPGISAASSAASLLGAPLMNDFVVLSLSDLLTPWELIEKRLHAAGAGDFAIALYNPRSRKRIRHLEIAREIQLQYKDPETPVGIVKHAMREQQEVILTNLDDLLQHDIDMFTTVIIGNSQTVVLGNKMVTRRGYIK